MKLSMVIVYAIAAIAVGGEIKIKGKVRKRFSPHRRHRAALPACSFNETLIDDEWSLMEAIGKSKYIFTGKVLNVKRIKVPAGGKSNLYRVYLRRVLKGSLSDLRVFVKEGEEDSLSGSSLSVERPGALEHCAAGPRPRLSAIFLSNGERAASQRGPTPRLQLLTDPVPLTLYHLDRINAAVKDELIHTVNISKPKYCFLSPNAYQFHYKTLKNITSLQNFFIYGKTTEEGMGFNELASGTPRSTLMPADHEGKVKTSLILYSSGTTGLPKGAKITNFNLITTLHQQQITLKDLTIMSVAPWCNTMGALTLNDSLCYGRTYVFFERFDENLYLEAIEKYKVGILLLAPPTLIVLSKTPNLDKYDVSPVEVMCSGGAPLDSDVITLVKKRFRNLSHVIQGYGMTESTGIVCREIDTDPKQGSVGKVSEGLIVKVVDVETRKILGPNKPGEICVKGLTQFDGYIGKERGDDFDEDGYFKTGDVAYYDEEGFFFIVDRIKELIKYKAWQVSPSELEAILLLHPSVKDVGVVGTPDPSAGELPTAFIVKKPGTSLTEQEIVDLVAKKVSPWKRLRGGVKFLDEIPKTGSGKILRRQLKQMVQKIPTSKL